MAGSAVGTLSSTNFSPSRLDCFSSAWALAGSAMSPLTVIATSADRVSGVRVILSTRPTATSLTLTLDCGTRSSTSVNSAVTWYGWSPTSAPPGSGVP